MRAAPLKVGMMIDTDLASMGHPLAAHAAGGVANNTALGIPLWGTMDDHLATSRFRLRNARHEIGSSRRLEDSAPWSCSAAAAFEERDLSFRVGIRARDTSIE